MIRPRIAGSSARLIVAGIAVGAVVSACTIGTDDDSAKAPATSSVAAATQAPASAPAATPAAPAAPAPAGAVAIEVKDMRFAPSAVTVHKGQTVTWKFDDGGIPHQISGLDDAGMAINSRILNNGEYSHTFDRPGVYKYICSLHPEMKGTITVE